jgi:TolA-binding protein
MKNTLLLGFVLVSGLPGCLVQQRDFDVAVAKTAQIEKDLQQSRVELEKTRADLEATRVRLDNALRASADSSSEFVSSKQRLNELVGRVDEAQHGVDELKREVGASRTEIYARLDDLKRTQQPAPPVAPPIAVPAERVAHFAQLKEAHGKREWSTVRVLGPEYLNRYPADEHADEAIFFAGDADLQDGRPSSALAHFNRVLKLFPRSRVLDRTLFAMGDAYLMMHDCTNAKVAYEACEKRFTKDKLGSDSRAKLEIIRKSAPGLCAPP